MRMHLLLATALIFTLTGNVRADETAERAKFKGKWVAIAVAVEGRWIPDAFLKAAPWYWIVDDEKILSKQTDCLGKIHEEAIRIATDPSKSPKTIDFTDMAKKGTNKGIYEFDGDMLKICFATNPARLSEPRSSWAMYMEGKLEICFVMKPGRARPGDFTAKKDTKRVLMVWKPVAEPLPVRGASTVGFLGSPLGQGPLLAASVVFPGRALPRPLNAEERLPVREVVPEGPVHEIAPDRQPVRGDGPLRLEDIRPMYRRSWITPNGYVLEGNILSGKVRYPGGKWMSKEEWNKQSTVADKRQEMPEEQRTREKPTNSEASWTLVVGVAVVVLLIGLGLRAARRRA